MPVANVEQLEILNQGVTLWNEWRENHPEAKIDLEFADLTGMSLDGVNFNDALLNGANLSCTSMDHAQLVRATLNDADLTDAKLKNANLTRANLTKANLAFANLEDVMLPYARLVEANLSAANLAQAHAEDACFHSANLSYASLKKAVLSCSDFRHASLIEADLTGANISSLNLESANVSLVKYDQATFLKTLRESRYRLGAFWKRRFDFILGTTIRCKGTHAAACFGSQRFKLFLQDQDYLEEMMSTKGGTFWCFIWWVFADCGRSLMRWAGWSVLIALAFGIIYWLMGPNFFRMYHLEFSFLNLLYYSIVTFTTLGFGDIAPITTTAAFVVSLEVILGYVMLGGLISIFSGKLSRRSS
jgi:uncharacterized protein YjbI with pentapeptide repeats